MKTIHKILIANRGEIACRIIRTCNRLGIATVAVYSDIDRGSVFVRAADEAVKIGESGITTYLDQERIIRAVKETGADAVHPGYGLLSENPEFAARCRDEKILFIGPSPEAIALMGSKIAARELCEKTGVPIVPGFRINDETTGELSAKASSIGFPVLLKASAGGGGIGIFRVEDESRFESVLLAARKKTLAIYGDESLLVEKYLSAVRHIEFQILGDEHGNAIHCFERECSVQRRHQKLLEESPSPAMTDNLRKRMGDAAVAIAKAARYTNAGTVEFILTGDGSFYFLEMNTRLQVEHPVTEAVTGLDLVEMQIGIAEGAPLPVRQSDLSINGHAVECRIYAEDPDNDFLPSAGRLHKWTDPQGPGARADSGVATSSDITIDFDPLMAKIITHADSRPKAIRMMNGALRNTVALGVATNIGFLSRLLADEKYLKGDITTDFFEKENSLSKGIVLKSEEADVLLIAASIALFGAFEESRRQRGWQGTHADKKYVGLRFRDADYSVGLCKKEESLFEIDANGTIYNACLDGKGGDYLFFVVNGRRQKFHYAVDGDRVFLHSQNYGHHTLRYLSRFQSMDFQRHGKGSCEAPMDGRVSSVRVRKGDRVDKGQALLIIESMKMENIIMADKSGIIKEIAVKQGDFVTMGSILIEIEKESDS